MGEPRYAVIASDLMSRLAGGERAVGSLLPAEPELASSCKVPRETPRRALRQLETGGPVSRHPGTGTRVERTRPVAAFGYVPSAPPAARSSAPPPATSAAPGP
ncbi:GntR family transcriptional regulator [Streptomyces sp. NPDC059092]|uniref:GntR family transcriptional regulator n=1 Tax=Streptomyces sp. NPDC059092 TaxID=3346725 RepID=UPI0036C92DE6